MNVHASGLWIVLIYTYAFMCFPLKNRKITVQNCFTLCDKIFLALIPSLLFDLLEGLHEVTVAEGIVVVVVLVQLLGPALGLFLL